MPFQGVQLGGNINWQIIDGRLSGGNAFKWLKRPKIWFLRYAWNDYDRIAAPDVGWQSREIPSKPPIEKIDDFEFGPGQAPGWFLISERRCAMDEAQNIDQSRMIVKRPAEMRDRPRLGDDLFLDRFGAEEPIGKVAGRQRPNDFLGQMVRVAAASDQPIIKHDHFHGPRRVARCLVIGPVHPRTLGRNNVQACCLRVPQFGLQEICPKILP